MARCLLMTCLVLVLTAVVLEAISSSHGSRSHQKQPQDQSADEPEAHEVKITIRKPVKLEPALPPVPPQRDERAVAQAPLPPPLESSPFTPSALDYVKGARLLETSEGSFPQIQSSYARLGWPIYRDVALRLGGSFFVWNQPNNLPVAQIEPRTGETSKASIAPDLSRWPRDVTKHMGAALDRAQAEFGESATHIVLLPPARLDAALLSGLNHLLQQNDVDPGSVSGFFGAYELRGQRLYCVVLSTLFKDGTTRPVSFSIDLSGASL